MLSRQFLKNRVRKPKHMNTEVSTAYNYKVVRQFAIMTVVWGIVGMGLGVLIAAQLAWPELNFNLPGPALAACARCTPTR